MLIISLHRQVLYITLCLALLFAVLEPEPSRGLPFFHALLFWLAHIGCGLLLALLVVHGLNRHFPRRNWPVVVQILFAGLLASMVFAPIALMIEGLFPPAPDVQGPDSWLDVWELAGGWQALVAEWLQLLPSYMCAWMLVNAVPLVQLAGRLSEPNHALNATHSEPQSPSIQTLEISDFGLSDQGVNQTPNSSSSSLPASDHWLDQLPPAIGRSLVRIEADLHYLNVYTDSGRAMLLGNLSVATEALGDTGIRVHRSHWVAFNQVKRVYRSGNGWFCELRDGHRIPVSRRRTREVHQRIGRDFIAS